MCSIRRNVVSNNRYGSRSLPDLTGHLRARAGDGHAPPLDSSGNPFRVTFILSSPLVKFSVLYKIKPHAAPLVVRPRQFLKVSTLRPYFPGGGLNAFASTPHNLVGCTVTCPQCLWPGLLGYLIRFAPLAVVPHSQNRSRWMLSPSAVLRGL